MFDVESVQWYILMSVFIAGFMYLASCPKEVVFIWVYVSIQLSAYPVYYMTLLFLMVIVTLLVRYRNFASRA